VVIVTVLLVATKLVLIGKVDDSVPAATITLGGTTTLESELARLKTIAEAYFCGRVTVPVTGVAIPPTTDDGLSATVSAQALIVMRADLVSIAPVVLRPVTDTAASTSLGGLLDFSKKLLEEVVLGSVTVLGTAR